MAAKILASACLAATLGACAFHHNVAWDAIDYNRSMADVTNSVVLLNVLRASDRLPMHFSHLSKVSGKVTYGLQTQLNFPFGQNLSTLGSATNTVTPLAKIEGGPAYDILSESDKDFMQGILSPVDTDRLFHFWNQGWNRDLLVHVFVESIEHICPDEKRRTYINTPFDSVRSVNSNATKSAKQEFRDFIKDNLLSPSVRMEKQDTFRPAGPYLLASSLQKIDSVTTALKEGMLHCRALQKGREVGCTAETPDIARRYRMGTRSSEIVFVSPDDEETIKLSSPKALKAQSTTGRKMRTTVTVQSTEGFQRTTAAVARKAGAVTCSANLVLRSVQGMIYYLGEIVRADVGNKYSGGVVKLRSREIPHDDTNEDLFLFRPVGLGPGIGDMSVTHKGILFRIPDEPASRSAQVLSLVEQLLGLHRKSDKFLSTQSVRVIN